MTYICLSKLSIIGPDNGLSRARRRQAIIWNNIGVLLIGNLRIYSEILSEIHTFSLKKMHLKMLSVKWRQIYLVANVLKRRRNYGMD